MKILTHPFFAFLIGLATGILVMGNIRYAWLFLGVGMMVWALWQWLREMTK